MVWNGYSRTLKYIMVEFKHSWHLCGKHINAMAHIKKKHKKNIILYFSQGQVLIYFMKMIYFILSVSNTKKSNKYQEWWKNVL